MEVLPPRRRRELSTDDLIDTVGTQKPPFRRNPQKEVHVWKTTFLILDGIDMSLIRTKDPTLDVSKELLYLEMEHTRNEIRPILRLLPMEKVIEDLRPVRIGCERDEERRLPKVTNNSH